LPPGFKPLYGDVNLDGEVRVTDIIEFNKYLIGLIDLNAMQKVNADTSPDGVLNVTDNMQIAGYLCGKISTLGPTE
jgi:hypothetical protein